MILRGDFFGNMKWKEWLKWSLCSFLSCVALQAEVSVKLSSQFIARGETCALELVVSGQKPDGILKIPKVEGVTMTQRNLAANMIANGNEMSFVYFFQLSSYEIGKHEIPSFEIAVNGEVIKTKPQLLYVFNPDDLAFQKAWVDRYEVPYFSGIQASKNELFEGESIPIELKVYIPEELYHIIRDAGVPELESQGIAAWRFQVQPQRTQVNILGKPYIGFTYSSVATAMNAGGVTLGDINIRMILGTESVFGIMGNNTKQLNIHLAKKFFPTKALPEGAPPGFQNIVGKFELDVKAQSTRIDSADPIVMRLAVKGSGNLDSIKAPTFSNSDGWKMYDARKIENRLGDVQPEFYGRVEFEQFILPTRMQEAIPEYRMVFFDPDAATYRILVSPKIPLDMKEVPPVASDAEANMSAQSNVNKGFPSIPSEKMTDILGLLPMSEHSKLNASSWWNVQVWWVHVLGLGMLMILILKQAWNYISIHWLMSKEQKALAYELKTIMQQPNDASFLKSIAQLIQRLPTACDLPELQAIIEKRDLECYRSQSHQVKLDAQERKKIQGMIQKIIRTLAIILIMFTSFASAVDKMPDSERQAAQYYSEGNYAEAFKLWYGDGSLASKSSEDLYHLGNASYRLGDIGRAALFYRRAIMKDASLQEAYQNVRFIEMQKGSVTPHLNWLQKLLTHAHIALYQSLMWLAIWAFSLTLLAWFLKKRSWHWWQITTIPAWFVLAVIFALAVWQYPKDSIFSSYEKQAVVVMKEAQLFTEASRSSGAVMVAPLGSVVHIFTISGDWAYVGFHNKTKGWMPLKWIEKLLPSGKMQWPVIEKISASKSNA